ncbi:LuxR C-terminal-related transcriptional regulator, partial [Sphaerisporangium aureirubrum]
SPGPPGDTESEWSRPTTPAHLRRSPGAAGDADSEWSRPTAPAPLRPSTGAAGDAGSERSRLTRLRPSTGPAGDADSERSRLTAPVRARRSSGAAGDAGPGAAPASTLAGGEEWARAAGARAFNLYFGLGREAEARAVLCAALRDVASPRTRGELEALRAVFTVFGGRCAEGLRLAGEAAEGVPRDSRARCVAETARALALAFLGDVDDGLAALREADELSLPWDAELPWVEVLIGVGAVHACLLAGRFAEAEARAADAYDRAVARRCQFAIAWACLSRALAAGARGDVHEQANRCREGIAITRDRHDRALRSVLLARLAHAQALTGDPAAATASLTESDHLSQPTLRLLHPWAELSRSWTAAAQGSPQAPAIAETAATLARASGAPALEALALHDTTRTATAVTPPRPEAASRARRRLAELAAASGDQSAVRLYAAHAEAVLAGDGAALGACSAVLEQMGSPLLAAEAAAEEAGRRRAAGDLAASCAAAARALRLAARTGARTPALDALERPHLTRRELQIAALAADGMSSREISAHFVLSVRTVENHLQRTYRKLGIGDRSELAALRGLFLHPSKDGP